MGVLWCERRQEQSLREPVGASRYLSEQGCWLGSSRSAYQWGRMVKGETFTGMLTELGCKRLQLAATKVHYREGKYSGEAQLEIGSCATGILGPGVQCTLGLQQQACYPACLRTLITPKMQLHAERQLCI